MYSSTAGKGSSRRASGPMQRVAVAKSSVALSELLHADTYIVRAQRMLATLATDCTSMIRRGYGIVEVVTRIGLFCCEARRRDESRILIKWEENIITNEGRKI